MLLPSSLTSDKFLIFFSLDFLFSNSVISLSFFILSINYTFIAFNLLSLFLLLFIYYTLCDINSTFFNLLRSLWYSPTSYICYILSNIYEFCLSSINLSLSYFCFLWLFIFLTNINAFKLAYASSAIFIIYFIFGFITFFYGFSNKSI